VLNRIVQGSVLAAALLIASVMPAAAAGSASVGLAILGDQGGPGIDVDFSKNFSATSSGHALGWLGDVSFNHKSFDTFGASDFSISTLLAQVGVRMSGEAGDKATWHVQGAAGIRRTSGNVSGLTADICNLAGVDCSASDTGGVFTPAGAVTYWFSANKGVKAQLNIPIGIGGGGGSTTRFDINFVWKMD
jgi:hypothetical protein